MASRAGVQLEMNYVAHRAKPFRFRFFTMPSTKGLCPREFPSQTGEMVPQNAVNHFYTGAGTIRWVAFSLFGQDPRADLRHGFGKPPSSKHI